MYNDQMMSPVAILSNRKTTIEITNLPSTMGREKDAVDIYLFHDSISRAHCMFECINSKVTVRDLGSAAGTYINGVKLEANVPYNLEEGCKLTVGKVKFAFHADYDEIARREQAWSAQRSPYAADRRSDRENRKKEVTVDAKELSIYEYDESEVIYIDCGLRPEKKHLSYTAELKKKEIEKVREEERKRRMLTLSWIDDETGDAKKLKIDSFPFSIGRKSDENDYAVRRKGMSRKHLHFEESAGRIYLVDDNSTNGVSLNGSKVAAGKRCELKEGDSISVAEITFSVSIS